MKHKKTKLALLRIQEKLKNTDQELAEEYVSWLERKTDFFLESIEKQGYQTQPDDLSVGDIVWVEFGINVGTELSDYKTSNDAKNEEQDNKITAIEEVNKTQDTNIQQNTTDITSLKSKTEEIETNLETNYYTKLETYTKEEVDEKFQSASAITIRRWA